MANRRKFIKNMACLGAGFTVLPALANEFEKFENLEINSVKSASNEEEYWETIQRAFIPSEEIINLNSGGVSSHPIRVMQAVQNNTVMSNKAPSYYMWRVLEKQRDDVRNQLAAIAGCTPEEIAINRNTTEGLGTVFHGVNLKAGDEVVHSNFVYPNMIQSLKMKSKREGWVLKEAKLSLPSTDAKALVDAYLAAFTSKTRLVLIEHVVNWTGQVMPVAEIAREARKRNILVVVDGAHSFGQFPFSIPDLGCDFFATSLHKWMCAPFGTGMLYVKQDKIAGLWPLFPSPEPESEDIRKFEALGTRNIPLELGIAEAISFHTEIDGTRKFQRLLYLRNYWVNALKSTPKIKFHSPDKEPFMSALVTVSIEGKSGAELANILQEGFKIHVTNINVEGIDGIRVTPNIYTSIEDLNTLVTALKRLAQS